MMALDFVNVYEPQIRWLQFLKYKTEREDKLNTPLMKRGRRRLREKECPRAVARFTRQGATHFPRQHESDRTVAL